MAGKIRTEDDILESVAEDERANLIAQLRAWAQFDGEDSWPALA